MTIPSNILFRVDAGRAIGLGHLRRSLSLAEALRQFGAASHFLTSEEPPLVRRIAALGFPCEGIDGIRPGSAEDCARTLKATQRHHSSIVVVDSYLVPADYLGVLRREGLFVVAIDDLALSSFPCHMVVSPGLHALEMPYRSSSGDTAFLRGPQYAMLSSEFWDTSPRTFRDSVEEILVTLGGGDPSRLLPKILDLAGKWEGDFRVTAVVGPFFENREELRQIATRYPKRLELLDAPASLRSFMMDADLAISAGGQTLFELFATGTPTVALQVAENQAPHLAALSGKGVVSCAGSVDEARWPSRVEKAVHELLGRKKLRQQMGEMGRQLVDGQGALRVAGEVLAHCARCADR